MINSRLSSAMSMYIILIYIKFLLVLSNIVAGDLFMWLFRKEDIVLQLVYKE